MNREIKILPVLKRSPWRSLFILLLASNLFHIAFFITFILPLPHCTFGHGCEFSDQEFFLVLIQIGFVIFWAAVGGFWQFRLTRPRPWLRRLLIAVITSVLLFFSGQMLLKFIYEVLWASRIEL